MNTTGTQRTHQVTFGAPSKTVHPSEDGMRLAQTEMAAESWANPTRSAFILTGAIMTAILLMPGQVDI
jgi:hypothetical protein